MRTILLQKELDGGWVIGYRITEKDSTHVDVTQHGVGVSKRFYNELISYDRAVEFFQDLGYR